MSETIRIVEPCVDVQVRLLKAHMFTVPLHARRRLDLKPRDRFQIELGNVGKTAYSLWVHLTTHGRVCVPTDTWHGLELTPNTYIMVRLFRPVRKV